MASDTATSTVEQSPPGSRRYWLRQASAFTRRYLRELLRNRVVLFWSVAFPAGFYLLTITVFIDTSQIPADAMSIVKASTAVSYGAFGAVVVCLNAFGQQLVDDVEADRYRQFRALPISPSADFLGRAAAGLLFAVGAVVAVGVVGLATGAEFALRSLSSVPILLVAFVGFALLWMALAVAVVVVVRDARYANVVTIAVAIVSYMLTGFNGSNPGSFAADPAWLNVLPNTLATRLMIYHTVDIAPDGASMSPPPVPSDPMHLALLAAYGLLAVAAGTLLTRRFLHGRGWSA
ncbi:MAG: ABC transporter permease [Haloarculaceae archaeon]